MSPVLLVHFKYNILTYFSSYMKKQGNDITFMYVCLAI
jgi:hypothetical protein